MFGKSGLSRTVMAEHGDKLSGSISRLSSSMARFFSCASPASLYFKYSYTSFVALIIPIYHPSFSLIALFGFPEAEPLTSVHHDDPQADQYQRAQILQGKRLLSQKQRRQDHTEDRLGKSVMETVPTGLYLRSSVQSEKATLEITAI